YQPHRTWPPAHFPYTTLFRSVLKRRGIGVDYMRVRSFPFSEDVERFLAAHELLFVVEQNRDAQLRSLLTLETAVEKSKLRSLLHYSGLPISSSFIVEGVLAELEPRQLATAQGAKGGRLERRPT